MKWYHAILVSAIYIAPHSSEHFSDAMAMVWLGFALILWAAEQLRKK